MIDLAPPGDWGLSESLPALDNFQQQRQDYASRLALSEKMAQQAADRRKEDQAAEAGLMDSLDVANKQGFAEPDKARTLEWERKHRNPVQELLFKANGDLPTFYAMGGRKALADYKAGLYTGKDDNGENPFQNATRNKQILAMAQTARDHGLEIAPIGKDNNGNEIPYDKVEQDFNNGVIHKLPWMGSANPVDGDPTENLRSRFGPDRGTAQAYTAKDVVADFVNQGMTPWQAERRVKNLLTGKKDAMGNPLTSVYTNSEPIDPLERQKKQAEIWKIYHDGNLKEDKQGAGSPENTAANGYLNLLGGLYNGTAPGYEDRYDEKNKNKYKVTSALNGTVIGTYENGNKDKIPDIVTGVKRHADGSLWFASTRTLNEHPDDPWERVSDLHTQLGKKYLKTDDAASGGLKVENAAYQLSKARGDMWKTGSPDYTLYGNDASPAVKPSKGAVDVSNIFGK